MEQSSVISGKKRGPKPTGKGTPVLLRVQPDLLGPIDTWIASQPEPKPSRPEAIRLALKDWLTGLGLLKAADDPEMAN